MVNSIYSFQYIILFICTIVSVNRKSGRWGNFFDSVQQAFPVVILFSTNEGKRNEYIFNIVN